jgi:hypothetical protein
VLGGDRGGGGGERKTKRGRFARDAKARVFLTILAFVSRALEPCFRGARSPFPFFYFLIFEDSKQNMFTGVVKSSPLSCHGTPN